MSGMRQLAGAVARQSRIISRRHSGETTRCFAISRPASAGIYGNPSAVLLTARRLQCPRRHLPIGIRSLFTSITKNYVELPPDYEDATGLPFSKSPLRDDEVSDIFGPGMNPAVANMLLRILHGRRVAGTLNDPEFQGFPFHYTKDQKRLALEYLRREVPVEEIINAGLRAEDELRELEGGADPNQPPSNRRGDAPPTSSKWASRLYKKPVSGDVYGESVLDEVRKRNIARQKAEDRLRKIEKMRREEEEAKARPGGLQTMDESKPREVELSPRMKEWVEAAVLPEFRGMDEPPQMPIWQRLWKAYVFVLCAVAGGAALATAYTPPDRRLFPKVSSEVATATGLVVANTLVWLAWKAPPMWELLNRAMIVVAARPRLLSLLGSAFSQQRWAHLFVNMVVLWFCGQRLEEEVGRGQVLQVYCASGMVGFLASLTDLAIRKQLHHTLLGSSGAVLGLLAAYLMMFKLENFKLFGLPPEPGAGVPGLVFLALLVAPNLRRLRAADMAIDCVSHLGGLAVGCVYGQYFAMRKAEKALALKERREERPILELIRAMWEKKA